MGDSRIVTALALVDMVIRVNRVLGPQFSAEQLNCTVRNNFVCIHIRLRAASSLENDQREVVDEFAGNHLSRNKP